MVADSDYFDEELDPDPHQDYVDPQYILNPDLVLDPGESYPADNSHGLLNKER